MKLTSCYKKQIKNIKIHSKYLIEKKVKIWKEWLLFRIKKLKYWILRKLLKNNNQFIKIK